MSNFKPANDKLKQIALYIILSGFSIVYISSITTAYGYFILGDDAMISMRYAYNFAHGNGLVWNTGEYVQGFTNLGFTLIMSAVHLFNLPLQHNSLIMQLLNLAILLGIISFLYQKGGWIPSLLAALSGSMFYWGLWGFESNLQALFILFAFYSRRYMLLWLALAFFIRADGIVFFILGAAAILYNKDKMQIKGLISGAFLVLVIFVFQKIYYGDFLPNTYYLKSDGKNGLDYLKTFLIGEFFHLPLFLGGFIYFWIKRDITKLILITGWTTYIFYIGEDCFPLGRFFIPVIPLLCLGTGGFIKKFAKKYIVLIPLTLLLLFYTHKRFFYEVKKDNQNDYLEIVNVLNQYPKDYLIATYFAGTIPYFMPDYKFHDLLGKCDKHIAKTPAKGGKTGHNKWDYDYSFSLQPDIIITGSHFRAYNKEIAEGLIASGYNYSFHPALYLQKEFNDKYHYVYGSYRLIYQRNL